MKNNDFLSHPLNRQEKIWGTIWLLFQTLLFSTLLQVLNQLLSNPFPQTVVNFVYFTINFTAVAILLRQYLSDQIRLIPEAIGKVLFAAISGFAAYWVMNLLLSQVLYALDPAFVSYNDITIQALVEEDFYLMLFGTVILVPIAEESLFRGLVFRGMYDRSPWLAWILSVALFSAIHLLGYISVYPADKLLLCFIQYLPAGIVLTASYCLSGSLLTPILIHATVNLVGMLALR